MKIVCLSEKINVIVVGIFLIMGLSFIIIKIKNSLKWNNQHERHFQNQVHYHEYIFIYFIVDYYEKAKTINLFSKGRYDLVVF